ncbi:MAG: histidine phosphatase family protein [Hyphomicrobiales bacterium]
MANLLRYLSHPQVKVDADVPVPDWSLSSIGRARTEAICGSASLQNTDLVVSSNERKAIETAKIIADSIGQDVVAAERTHENDRSATGFLLPEEFEEVANLFFMHPEQSVRGWERALDAQARIVEETNNFIRHRKSGDILMVGHGGVGTLLYLHFIGVPISREHDQPAGGGNFFAISLDTFTPLHGWCPMELI